jgi:hypothetical protein
MSRRPRASRSAVPTTLDRPAAPELTQDDGRRNANLGPLLLIAGADGVLATVSVDAARAPFPPGPGSGVVELVVAASLFWVLGGLTLCAVDRDAAITIRPAVGLLLAGSLAFAGLTVADVVRNVPGSAFGFAAAMVGIAIAWPWWAPRLIGALRALVRL